VLEQDVPATLTIDTSQSTPDTVIGVFAGESDGALTRLGVADGGGSTPGAARLSVSIAAGKPYTVLVDSKSGQTGGIRLYWNLLHPRPANDNFASAFASSSSSGSSRSWTWRATRESGEPYHAGIKSLRSVWWRWTAPRDGRIVFSGPVDGPFVAYRGSSLGSLTEVARGVRKSGSFGQVIEFIATKGTTYRVVIGPDVSDNGTELPGTTGLSWKLHPVPPPNDNLSSAKVVTGSSGSISGTTYGATPQSVDYGAIGTIEYPSTVWYRWKAPSSGWWTFSPRYSDAAATLGVRLPGTEQVNWLQSRPALWHLPYPGRQGTLYVKAVAGSTYNFVIGTGGPPLESDVRLYWSPGEPSFNPPPANDNLAKATALSGSEGAVNGTVQHSTSEPGEQHGYESGGVWYRWTAPESGRITWHTADGTGSTHLTFYRGSGTFGALTKLAENSYYPTALPAARVDVDVVAGTTYSIRVSGYEYSSAFRLTWGRPTPPPENDDFADAATLGPAPTGSVAGTLRWASREDGEPVEASSSSYYSKTTVWYRWRPGVDALATVGIDAGYSSRYVTVWTGSALDDLARVSSRGYEPNGHRKSFLAVAGETYWVQVTDDGDTSPFTLTWTSERPADDDFAAAREISGAKGYVSGLSVVGATAEPGEPVRFRDWPARNTIWLRWTAPHTAWTEFDLNANLSDLSVFTGESLTSLTRVGNSGNTTQVDFTAQAGQTYLVRVDGWNNWLSVAWEQRWDTTAPTVGVKADRTVATTRWVGLTLSGSDSGSGMRGWYVSNQAPEGGELHTGSSAWVPATSPSITWSVSHTAYGGRPADGLKRVYVQSIDNHGNRSAPVSVSVTLDRN